MTPRERLITMPETASLQDAKALLNKHRLERVLPLFEQPANVFAVMPVRSSQSLKLHLCLGFLRDHLAQGPHALQVA